MAHLLVLVYLILVYTRPQEYLPWLSGVPILPIFLGCSFIVWAAQPNKNFESLQHKILPLLLLVMCISVALSGRASETFVPISDYGPSVILFYLLSTTAISVEQHARAIRTLALTTVVLAVHGIEQTQSGVGWSGALLSQGTRITYVGIFSDPNDLALAFVVALPMLGFAYSTARMVAAKFIWLICIGIVAYGIFLTNSRGGMLAAMVILLFHLRARFGLVKTGVAAALLLVVAAMLPTRLNELDAKEESAAGRVDAWYQGIQMLQQNPIFGVGKGNYTQHHDLTAHNSFVLVFAELGLVGYFLWLSFLAISVLMVFRVARKSPDISVGNETERGGLLAYQKISKTYLHAMVGFLVCAFFLSRSYVILLVILCALCTALYQSVRQRWPSRFAPITAWPALGQITGMMFVTIFLMYLTVRILG